MLSVAPQVDADQLPVVAQKDMAVRESWVRPDHRPTARLAGRLQELRARQFFETGRSQFRENQLSLVVPKEEAVRVTGKKCRRPTGPLGVTGCHRQRLPNLVAGVRLELAEFSPGANSVNVTVHHAGCAHQSVQAVGVVFTLALAPSELAGGGPLRIQLEHE